MGSPAERAPIHPIITSERPEKVCKNAGTAEQAMLSSGRPSLQRDTSYHIRATGKLSQKSLSPLFKDPGSKSHIRSEISFWALSFSTSGVESNLAWPNHLTCRVSAEEARATCDEPGT